MPEYSPQGLDPVSSGYAASVYNRSRLVSSRGVAALVLFICILASLQSVQAQNVQRNNEAVDLGLRSDLTVNPATLAVELQIPLGNYPGRAGHDVPVTISYSSKVWNIVYQGFASGPPPGFPGPQPFTIVMAKFGEHSISGWNTTTRSPFVDPAPGNQLYDQFGHPRGSGDCSTGCYVIDRMLAWMPDGSAHELRSSDQALWFTDPRPDNLYSVDGSRLRYQRSSSTLFLPDGSRYVLANPGGYIDRNGNTINATDTLGRTIGNPLPYNPGFSPSAPVDQNYSVPGVGVGGTINYVLKWKYLGDVLTTPQQLAYVANSGCPPGTGSTFSPYLFTTDVSGRVCIQNASQPFNPVVLSQIVLPTGQSYTFTYNIFGEIDKVTLPSGGYEKFVYGQMQPLSSSSYVYAQYNRGVTQRTVSRTGFSADEVSWVYVGGGGYVKTVAPDGTWTERYAWGDGNSWWGFSSDGARAGRAYDERVYSASSQMLRRKLTEWAMTGSNATWNPGGLEYANRNARVTRETEFILDTGGGALAKTTTYGYDLTYQFGEGIDQTSVSQYDYVLVDQNTAQTLPVASLSSIPNGTLLRTTQTAYLTSNINYRSRNIVGVPTATTIYKGSPADSNVVSQQLITYDEGGSFAQLNDYGTVVNWTDPQTPYRANPTTARQWLNYDGATLSTFPNGTYLATHARYDQCGSVRIAWDARDTGLANPSQTSYQDAFSDGTPRNTFAFPTSMTSAVPDSSSVYGSNVAFTTTTIYDFNTGKVISATDVNAKTTSYDYTDSLNRLKQVTQADTSRVRYNYFDAPGDLYVQVLIDEDASRSIETRKYFDGLGRPIRNFSYEGTGATPWLVADTYYDTSGRVSKVSNPYRVSGANAIVPPTCSACTTTVYDGLNRVLTMTTADNAQVLSSYSGSSTGQLGIITTIMDQAGRKRRTLTDALGRLLRVDEPHKDTGNLDVGGASTVYTYDVLGRLLRVDQDTQRRFFMYDSLGRLLRAKNPEQGAFTPDAGGGFPALTDSSSGIANDQWSTGYLYDANNNQLKRRDARNVATIYAYDGLNRITTVDYSDTAGINPDLTNIYDSATNGKGRLRESYAGGNETVGANVEHTKIHAYDVLGRPTDQRQRFKSSSVWSAEFRTQRTYDLAGHVKTQSYPSGRSVTYNYDLAGRLGDKDAQNLAFTGTLGDNALRTYAAGMSYSEFGGLQQEQFGTQTALFHKLHYNIRGQLYDARLSTASWATDQWNWNRGALVLYFGYAHQQSGPLNNGNVSMMEHSIPANEQITAYNYTQQRYTYDLLNRLTSVAEYPGTQAGLGAVAFTQIFDYDRWGNRTINPATTNAPEPQFTASASTNRLGVPAGQSGRMDYDPGGNLVNDTYTSFGRADGQPTRLYDAENRLTTAQDANLQVVSSYSYNAASQRTRRKIGAAETWQIYGMEGELLAEYASNAAPVTPQKEYGYRDGQLLISTTNGASGSPVTQNVTWTNAVGVAVSGNSITKNVATGWGNSGASSTQTIASGDGYVEFTPTYLGGLRSCGLSNGDANQNYTEIDFGIYLGAFGNNYSVYENGVSKYLNGPYAATDIFRVAVEGGVVKYYRNGTLFYTSATAPVYPLLVDTAIYTSGYPINNVVMTSTPSNPSEVFWLVPDHLGTPRMIVDKTGALASIKRHDYLPFGEELGLITGRTPVMGYSSNDTVRQKFTEKERDGETGWDYFGARYFASVQGRFTGADPFNIVLEVQGEAEYNPKKAVAKLQKYLTQPQQWNRYSYAINNPLLFVDPNGEAIRLSNDKDERAAQMQALREAVGSQAGAYLYENLGDDGNYYVGIYGQSPTGDTRSFAQLNDVASQFSVIITDSQVATLELVGRGNVTDDSGSTVFIGRASSAGGESPGATGYFKGKLTIKMLDWRKHDMGYLPGEVMSDGKDNMMTKSVLVAHELAHAWDLMCGLKNKFDSNTRAVEFENKVRRLQYPNGPTRARHNRPAKPGSL